MAHVLLATDLTPYGDRSLDRAVLLAGPAGPLGLVYAVSDELLPEAAIAPALAEGEAALARYIADAGLPAGLDVSATARIGEPGPVIVQAARTGCELVVLGAAHGDLLVRLFQRSVVNHVVRHAPCPVVIVRHRARQPYRRVLLATDMSLPARRALEFALRLLPGAEMVMIHASHGGVDAANTRLQLDDLATASLARHAALGGIPPASLTVEVAAGRATDIVAQAAARLDVDLVVVGTLGLSGAAHLLLGSTAEALIDRLGCDVLAVRPVDAAAG